jgi:DNA adenine methylase
MRTMPIISWIGGKRRLAKQILPLFPAHVCYCEPFAGGEALFFLKEPSEVEVLNEINGDLINLYRIVKFHKNAFVDELNLSFVSRELFEWFEKLPSESLTETCVR